VLAVLTASGDVGSAQSQRSLLQSSHRGRSDCHPLHSSFVIRSNYHLFLSYLTISSCYHHLLLSSHCPLLLTSHLTNIQPGALLDMGCYLIHFATMALDSVIDYKQLLLSQLAPEQEVPDGHLLLVHSEKPIAAGAAAQHSSPSPLTLTHNSQAAADSTQTQHAVSGAGAGGLDKLRAPDSVIAVGLSDHNGVDVETSFVLTVSNRDPPSPCWCIASTPSMVIKYQIF
jgi:hypothetical protein